MGVAFNVTQIVIILIFAIGGVIYAIVTLNRFKSLPDIDLDTKIANLLPEFADGHAEGILKEVKLLKNGCTKIVFYPTDLDKEQRENQEIVPQTIIAKNVVPMSKGTFSSRINKIWILPNYIQDLKNKLPVTDIENLDISKIFRHETIERHAMNNMITAIKERDMAQEAVIIDFSGTQLNKILMKRDKEAIEDLRRMTLNVQQEKEDKEKHKI